LYFIENNLDDSLSQNEIEHILDFVYSNKKKYAKISNKTILEKANKWTKELQERASKNNLEIE